MVTVHIPVNRSASPGGIHPQLVVPHHEPNRHKLVQQNRKRRLQGLQLGAHVARHDERRPARTHAPPPPRQPTGPVDEGQTGSRSGAN